MNWRDLTLGQKEVLKQSIPAMEDIYNKAREIPYLKWLLFKVVKNIILNGYPINKFISEEICFGDLSSIKDKINLRNRIFINNNLELGHYFAYIDENDDTNILIEDSIIPLMHYPRKYVYFLAMTDENCLILFRADLDIDKYLEKNNSLIRKFFN